MYRKKFYHYFFLLCISLLAFFLFNCSAQRKSISKINGISLVATKDTVDQKDITSIRAINANWVSLMPFGFMKRLDAPKIYYNQERQWYGETSNGIKHTAKLIHNYPIKVMLKPQIWIGNGKFTGNIQMATEQDWNKFEKNYTKMMMLYAKLAEETDIEMLCIGTELNNFVQKRPDFWIELINKIRGIYDGKITYAENWDQLQNVGFWEKLDFIGVNAYFPISDAQTPHLAEVKKSWQPIKQRLQKISLSKSKKILFSEYGYRSMDYAGKKPWKSDQKIGKTNYKAQNVLLKGILDTFWDESWFAGGFLWKWFPHFKKYKARHHNRFSIQEKPAQKTIRQYYQN